MERTSYLVFTDCNIHRNFTFHDAQFSNVKLVVRNQCSAIPDVDRPPWSTPTSLSVGAKR
jgi:hypothetical protein